MGKHCFPAALQSRTILESLLLIFSLPSTSVVCFGCFFNFLGFFFPFQTGCCQRREREKLEEKHDQVVFFTCVLPSALSQVTGLLFPNHHYLFRVELLSGAPGSSGKLVQCSRSTALSFQPGLCFSLPFSQVMRVKSRCKSLQVLHPSPSLQISTSWGEEFLLQSSVTNFLFFPWNLIHRIASEAFCWGPGVLWLPGQEISQCIITHV